MDRLQFRWSLLFIVVLGLGLWWLISQGIFFIVQGIFVIVGT